jgi:hypothetical protein
LSRLAAAIVVVFLLGGTAVAFAVTQGLKLEKSPVLAPAIDKEFSPAVGDARIAFSLRERDRVTLAIVDSDGEVVRTLVAGRRLPTRRVRASWDGRDDAGRVVADGDYRPRVRLADAHRTIVFPNEIRVDAARPTIEELHVSRRVISPDGDGRADGVSVSYRVSERARVRLLVNGKPRARKRGQQEEGAVQWYGRVRGRALRPGTYALSVVAVDLAGNRSEPVPAGAVRIRYLELGLERIRARAGTRFGVRVRTHARRYSWLFAGRLGRSTARYLVLRAPREPGRYRLFVESRGRGDSALVVIGPNP